MFLFSGRGRVEEQLEEVLQRLATSAEPGDFERELVDVKEEPGRRGPDGAVLPGSFDNEDAAKYLTGELACMANTPHGGAIVLGAADRPVAGGTCLIGTELNIEWLRQRVFELSSRLLTVDVTEIVMEGFRLLVLRVPPAVEPIRWQGKVRWRVGVRCVEIDPARWFEQRLIRAGHDASASPSGRHVSDVSSLAVEFARRFLRERVGDTTAAELAATETHELLSRIGVTVAGTDELNMAGALLFVGTGFEAIDYIHRPFDGADSTIRVKSDRSLLEQLWLVMQALEARDELVHVPGSLTAAQLRRIPLRAAREAIVNGVAHRDWHTTAPTTVEHIGDMLIVTSPGGLVAGVTSENILSHPSTPRHRTLATALARLRLAELEGIGVDRMFVDQLTAGHPYPVIAEISGPSVQAVLVGGDPDRDWVEFLSMIEPAGASSDLRVLILLRQLIEEGWVDVATSATRLQRPTVAARAAIDRLRSCTWKGNALVTKVAGTASDDDTVRLANPIRERLLGRLPYLSVADQRKRLAVRMARRRGRISSTEFADLVGISVQHAGRTLVGLVADGYLMQNRDKMVGRGAAYLPIQPVGDSASRNS